METTTTTSMKLTSSVHLPVAKTTFFLAVCFTMFLLFLLSSTRSNFLLNDPTLAPIPSQILSSAATERRRHSASGVGNSGNDTTHTSGGLRQFQNSNSSSRGTTAGGDGRWLREPLVSNFTDRYIELLTKNGSSACHQVSTETVRVVGLPENGRTLRMAAGVLHRITLISVGSDGAARCFGGDYFETDLSSEHWKSRPPVTDNEDGTYSVFLQVHPAFAGLYSFKVFLSFSNYHGLHRRPERWFRNQTVMDVKIEFGDGGANPASPPPPPKECSAADFGLDSWAGRWTRGEYNRSCTIDGRGRYASCMNASEECDERRRRWCRGPAALLESNGWVYSAHCSFRIFAQDEAWKCLDKKWLFFWGDSNHVDTIRNLLNFALGVENVTEAVRRRFDAVFRRPTEGGRQAVRITSFFNGHANVSLNHQGLYSLSEPGYRSELLSYFFSGDNGSMPDAVVMNSGLHDGMYWKYTQHFAEKGAKAAAEFWSEAMGGGGGRRKSKPRTIYRTTVAAAAWGRAAAFNPQKMEVYNGMMIEAMRKAGLIWGVVDGMDLSYPWHYDNECSDGVHYGKPPAASEWYGGYGHKYFVDLMLVHILLHAICED